MQKLITGYRWFRTMVWPEQRRLYEALARGGQNPKTLIIACIDSRVDPTIIFNVGPGEVLIVRNVANLVPPYQPNADYHGTSAALEFAVQALQVSQIVVLGHGSCGGVRALLEGAADNIQDFVAPWMSIAKPAKARAMTCTAPEQRQQCCEHEVVKLSLSNLMSYPWVKTRVEDGSLSLHGAWFAIATGQLMMLQPDGEFAVKE